MNTHHSAVAARALAVLAVSAITVTSALAGSVAYAAEAPVGLGTAARYAVVGAAGVTNATSGTNLIGADLGAANGAITGFPPGLVTLPGVIDNAGAPAAIGNARTAYNNAAGRPVPPGNVGKVDLGGQTLQPGVYSGGALSLTNTVTLDNGDDPDAVFIFKASSTLITGSNSTVAFTNAQHASCNVFWQVGSSATLGSGSDFVGTVVAQASVTAVSGASLKGRLIALTGSVTLDNNVITRAPCAAVAPTTPTTPTTTATATTTRTTTTTRTVPSTPTTRPAPTTPTRRTTPTTRSVIPPPRDVTSGSSVTLSRPSTRTTVRTNTTQPTQVLTSTSVADTSITESTYTYPVDTTDYDTSSYAAGGGSGTDSGTGELANTGSSLSAAQTHGLVLGGLAAVIAGWFMMLLSTVRRPQPGRHRGNMQ